MPNTNLIFTILKVVTWIIFIGLCIDAGGLIVNFIVSIYNPDFVQNLYQKLDMSQIYKQNRWSYFSLYSLIISIATLKAVLFYLVIILVTTLDIAKPFNTVVAKQILKISYFTISIGLISYIAQQTVKNLSHHGYSTENLYHFFTDSQAFILMSAVIYVIATIFKKGVDLQTENDLTI